MAGPQVEPNTKRLGRQSSVPNHQGSQRIKTQQAVRKSPRLQATLQSHKPSLSKSHHKQQPPALTPTPSSDDPAGRKALKNINTYHENCKHPRKRQRSQEQQESEHPSLRSQDKRPPKRLRASSSSCIIEEDLRQEVESHASEDSCDSIQYWVQTGKWPKKDFEQDNQVKEDFERGKFPEELERWDWQQEHYAQVPSKGIHAFPHLSRLFARERSSSSPHRRNSQSTLLTPSDQLPREIKSAQYRDPEYEIVLASKGSYMRKSSLGIKHTGKSLCRDLLEMEQQVPQNTLFRDDLFDETCESVQGRNETMVIRDISPLICPSAQVLKIRRAIEPDFLEESVNEGWNSAISFYGTRPQPDYSCGFALSAFTKEQLNKLEPFVGEIGSKSKTYFMATTRIYFPFLTCEVKCGDTALDIADRQNAHSMTIAIGGIVELFKAVKREKEIHRRILAFSISHDHNSVRIYGHYPIIEENRITYYRHPIDRFSFVARDGKDKWTTYKFVKNLYNAWVPIQHRKICSAIDDLPSDIDFDL